MERWRLTFDIRCQTFFLLCKVSNCILLILEGKIFRWIFLIIKTQREKIAILNKKNVVKALLPFRYILSLSDIRCQTFFVLWPKICPTVLWERCENRNRGLGGGLLLLAACTDGPLLLVRQARKSMSQPAECAVNWPTDVGRNPSLQQIFVNQAFIPTPPWVYSAHTFMVLKLLS